MYTHHVSTLHTRSLLIHIIFHIPLLFFFFFFNDTATTEIYTLSLHDALPILDVRLAEALSQNGGHGRSLPRRSGDRKSTRLNSSHLVISYAAFCFKKKKKNNSVTFTSRIVCSSSLCLTLILS